MDILRFLRFLMPSEPSIDHNAERYANIWHQLAIRALLEQSNFLKQAFNVSGNTGPVGTAAFDHCTKMCNKYQAISRYCLNRRDQADNRVFKSE